jgi:DNA-binding MarR family transcriptional regulator
MLSLTPQGQAVRRKLANAFQEICTGLVADWKREDRAEFTRLLDKLADRLRKEGVY